MTSRSDRLRPYPGPPGDDRTYYLPRDEREWYDAFDAYYREHPDQDPQRSTATEPTPEPSNAWDDVPF